MSASGQFAPPARCLRQADESDEVIAYLPLAWVGDHYLNYVQGYVAGFCVDCPETAETAVQRSARDRHDLSLRAAAGVRKLC